MPIINRITAPSNVSPRTNDRIDAINRIIIILSVNCSKIILKIVFLGFCFSSFVPYSSCLLFTSSVVSPVFSLVFNSSVTLLISF